MRRPRPTKAAWRPRMNSTERAYANRLEVMKRSGEILDYRFEGMKLRMARNTYYTPDFLVVTIERIEFHEVKGFWREDARVKWKVAAELFPWAAFIAVQLKGRVWEFEEYGSPKKGGGHAVGQAR